MFAETRKLHLIEEMLKINNEALLFEVERVINNANAPTNGARKSFREFAGLMTDKKPPIWKT